MCIGAVQRTAADHEMCPACIQAQGRLNAVIVSELEVQLQEERTKSQELAAASEDARRIATVSLFLMWSTVIQC